MKKYAILIFICLTIVCSFAYEDGMRIFVNGIEEVNNNCCIPSGNAEITGDLDVNGDITSVNISSDIVLNSTPLNLSYSGKYIYSTVDVNTIGIGAVLYIASDGNYELCNADTMSTMLCSGIALETGTGIKKILIEGYIRNDSWNLTVNSNIYADDSDGLFTHEPPSGTSQIIQSLGYAKTSKIIHFKPSLDYMEHD